LAAEAQRDKLVEAIEWYADASNYETHYETLPCDCCTDIFEPIDNDKGEKARATLDAMKGTP